MAVPTTLHIGRPCMQCTRPRPRALGGGGGRPHRRAGRGHSYRGAGGGGGTCVCAMPYCSMCALLHRSVLHCTMRAVLHRTAVHTACVVLHGTTLCTALRPVCRATPPCVYSAALHCAVPHPCASCTSAQGGGYGGFGACAANLRSQPPPHHLSRDDGCAAPVAPRPLRTYHSRCSPCFAAAMTSRPLRGQPPPRYQSRNHRGAATATGFREGQWGGLRGAWGGGWKGRFDLI